MPFRISEDDKRAAKVLNSESMDGARAYCMNMVSEIDKKGKHGRIDNILPLAEAAATYQEIAADPASSDEGVREQQEKAYMNALFQGTREEVLQSGCWRCERDVCRPFAGAVSIRHEGDRHYLVFTDASGNSTEYRIWFCPYCGKKF